MLFKLAFYGIYEPLLFKKYPSYYMRYLNWFDSWAFPSYYSGYYTLPFFIWAGIALNNVPLLYAGALLFAFSYAISVYALFRKKVFDMKDFISVCFHYLYIPYLRLFWVLAGFIIKWQ
jgi:hypothetical protein